MNDIIQQYIARDHNPDSPENRIQLREYFEGDRNWPRRQTKGSGKRQREPNIFERPFHYPDEVAA